MTIKKFSPGNKVKHKSSDRILFVHDYEKDMSFLAKRNIIPKVICKWIDDSGVPHQESFDEQEIEFVY